MKLDLAHCEEGQAALEYAFVMTFVVTLLALLVVGAGPFLGNAIDAAYQAVAGAF